MGKILEKLMKKYLKNAKNTGKVYEKILEKCKKKLEKSGKFVSPKKWEPCYDCLSQSLFYRFKDGQKRQTLRDK